MKTINIQNLRIYGIEESKIAATYPMLGAQVGDMENEKVKPGLARKLFLVPNGSGHDCFSKGITVQFDLTAPEYFWRQIDRYHFIDHVSSQSKMHCITKFKIEDMCNDEVDQRIIEILKEKIAAGLSHRQILSNIPAGLMMTSRMTTNILQLKSIYSQRKNHKLPEWREFCEWINGIFVELDLVNEI